MKDEDILRDMVDATLDDLESCGVIAFTVSRFEPSYKDVPFWEKGE